MAASAWASGTSSERPLWSRWAAAYQRAASCGRGGLGGLDEHRDGLGVAGLGAAFEVVRALGGRAVLGGAGVGREAPAGTGRLVDRAGDDRVAEAVLRDQTDQPVERDERFGEVHARGDRGEAEVERLTHDGGAEGEPAGVVAERGELLPDRRGDRARHAALRLAREFEQVERVAAAEAVEVPGGAAEQRVGLGLAERLQRDLLQAPAPCRGLDRPELRRRQAAVGERDHAVRRPPKHLVELVGRDVVDLLDVPVELLEQPRLADARFAVDGDVGAARLGDGFSF